MADALKPEAKRLEIKKYSNRRYYDATHSRHLTLEEIRDLVQQGYDLRAVEAKTGADITAQLLTQIILELDTSKLVSLPVPLLTRVIRMNDQLIKDFIEKYFNQALESFLQYQARTEEQIRRTHGLPESFPSVSAWTKAVLEPFTAPFRAAMANSTSSSEQPTSSEPSKDAEDLKEQIRQLQSQVNELSRHRAKNQRSPRRRRPKARRR